MSRGKGKKEESALKAAADEAARRAAEVDPLEQRQRAHVTALDDWRSGRSGPIDVRNMPGAGVGMSLFKEAKLARDAGRVGRGLATLEGGANPNFAAALDRETQLERDLNAAGMLEDHVSETLGNLDAKMMGLAQTGTDRKFRLADLARGRLYDLRSTKQPSFLKQMALGAIGAI